MNFFKPLLISQFGWVHLSPLPLHILSQITFLRHVALSFNLRFSFGFTRCNSYFCWARLALMGSGYALSPLSWLAVFSDLKVWESEFAFLNYWIWRYILYITLSISSTFPLLLNFQTIFHTISIQERGFCAPEIEHGNMAWLKPIVMLPPPYTPSGMKGILPPNYIIIFIDDLIFS